MQNKDTIELYLKLFFSGQPDLEKIEKLLHPDFTFKGPLMASNSRDEFISALKAMGPINMQADIHNVVVDGADVVAQFDFDMPQGKVPAAEWYKVENGQIREMRLYCDPRPFLDSFKS